MTSSIELFKQQLDDAVAIIDQYATSEKGLIERNITGGELVDAKSLLARCESVFEKHKKAKPKIRIIHHLACSGGTLISKCIAAMPNVFLLSEVHPYTDLALGKDKPKYAPTDIVSLAKYADIPDHRALAGKLFKQAIDEVYQHVNDRGGILVLRDHTHADFNTLAPIPESGSVVSLLSNDYQVESILTVRDPVDSYSSLKKNNWIHFEPATFDEYCRRLLLLLNSFKFGQIFRYEDFVSNPELEMSRIAGVLEVPYSDSFGHIFSAFKVTGDSGRSGSVIVKRPRVVDEQQLAAIDASKSYQDILAFFKKMES